MTTYVNANANQLLGAGEYFIITLRRGASLLGGPVFDSSYVGGVRNVYEKLAASGLAFPITRNAVDPGSKEVAFDVRTAAAGANATVGELAAKLQSLAGGAVDVAVIRRVEKGKTGQADRAEARGKDLAEAAKEPEPGIAGAIQRAMAALSGGLRGALLLAGFALVAYVLLRSSRK